MGDVRSDLAPRLSHRVRSADVAVGRAGSVRERPPAACRADAESPLVPFAPAGRRLARGTRIRGSWVVVQMLVRLAVEPSLEVVLPSGELAEARLVLFLDVDAFPEEADVSLDASLLAFKSAGSTPARVLEQRRTSWRRLLRMVRTSGSLAMVPVEGPRGGMGSKAASWPGRSCEVAGRWVCSYRLDLACLDADCRCGACQAASSSCSSPSPLPLSDC